MVKIFSSRHRSHARHLALQPMTPEEVAEIRELIQEGLRTIFLEEFDCIFIDDPVNHINEEDLGRVQ